MKTHFFFTGRQAEANSQIAISKGITCSGLLTALLILLGASPHVYAQTEDSWGTPSSEKQGLQIYTDEQGNRVMRTTPTPKNQSQDGGSTYYYIAPQIYPDSWDNYPSQPGWPGQPGFYPPGSVPGHRPGLFPPPSGSTGPVTPPPGGQPGLFPPPGGSAVTVTPPPSGSTGTIPPPGGQFWPGNTPGQPGFPWSERPGQFPGAGNQFIPGSNTWPQPGTPGSSFRPGQNFPPQHGPHNNYRPFPPPGHQIAPGNQFRPGVPFGPGIRPAPGDHFRPGHFPGQGSQFRPGYFPGQGHQFRPGGMPPQPGHPARHPHGGRLPSHP